MQDFVQFGDYLISMAKELKKICWHFAKLKKYKHKIQRLFPYHI